MFDLHWRRPKKIPEHFPCFLLLGLLFLAAWIITGEYKEALIAAFTPGLPISLDDAPQASASGMNGYFAVSSFCLLGFIASMWRGRFETIPGAFRPAAAVAAAKGPDPLLTLRSMACAMVVLGHMFYVFFPPMHLEKSLRTGSAVWLLTSSPWAGVWIFFTLSGYLMGKAFFSGRYALSGAGMVNFYRNRLYRIVPVYLFVGLFVIVLVRPELLKFTHTKNAWHLLEFLSFDYPLQPVGLFWSIGVEMHFYALAPFLCLALYPLWRAHPLWLPALVLALVLIGIVGRTEVYIDRGVNGFFTTTYSHLAGNLDLFLIGLLANTALPWLRTRLSGHYCLPAGLALLPVLYLICAYISSGEISGDEPFSMAFTALLPSLTALLTATIILLCELGRERGGFAAHPISRLIVARTQMAGVLTYCLYAWHEPVLYALKKTAKLGNISVSVHDALTALPPLLLISLVTYYTIELPFDRKRAIASLRQ